MNDDRSPSPHGQATASLPQLLRLLHLASPALPVGGFAYSQGLESAIHCGIVHDADSAQHWIGTLLNHGLARLEAPLWLRLHAAAMRHDEAEIGHWNAEVLATRETAELRAESSQMGASMLRGLGVQVDHLEAPFDPEGGAYERHHHHKPPHHADADEVSATVGEQLSIAAHRDRGGTR